MPVATDVDLLSAFVAAFGPLGALEVRREDPVATSLEEPRGSGRWRPRPADTPRRELERLTRALGVKLPPLYESLVLGWRWADADLGTFVLGANPPGRTLGGLAGGMRGAGRTGAFLLKAGLVPIGRGACRGSGTAADPVCFATARRRPGGDCPVVQLDAAELGRGQRLRVSKELAPTFRQLVLDLNSEASRRRVLASPITTSAAAPRPAGATLPPSRRRRRRR